MARQVGTSHIQATGSLAGVRINYKIHSSLVPAWRWMKILPTYTPVFFRAKIAHRQRKEDQSIAVETLAGISSLFKLVPEYCASYIHASAIWEAPTSLRLYVRVSVQGGLELLHVTLQLEGWVDHCTSRYRLVLVSVCMHSKCSSNVHVYTV